MKAQAILLRTAQGFVTGGLFRLGEIGVSIRSLAAVIEDISTGVVLLEGVERPDAEALAGALRRECHELDALHEQLALASAQIAHFFRTQAQHELAIEPCGGGVVPADDGA